MSAGAAGKILGAGRFYGEVLGMERGCGGLLLSDARYEAGRRLPRHSHELGFFCLLLGGAYSEHYAARTLAYEPFSIVFHPPGEAHATDIGRPGIHVFNIEVHDHWLARLREYARVPDTFAELRGGDLVWLAVRLYREYRGRDACSPLVVEGLVLEMLAVAARREAYAEKRAPVWLSQARELLHADFRRRLTVNEVAASVGVHPFHLSRVFRQFYREGVGEYVRRLRVAFASRQLCDPEADLAEVALAAGFADQSHFTRAFKQVTGTTPGAFRAALGRGRMRRDR